MLDIVVQIVSYKTKRYLPECLDSVITGLGDSGLKFKISVLENGSHEDISEIENEYKSRGVVFYHSNENLGFGGGHNFLAQKEKSAYLLALNPDTIVLKTSTEQLFSFMEAHPDVGLCGPRIEEPLGFWEHKKTFWPDIFTLKSFFERFFHIKILKNITSLEFSPILGAAFFFRRKAFDEIGGFDEHLFLYFEEGDICNSLKTKGWKIFFIYNAAMVHFYERKELRPQNAKRFAASKAYFYKKWPRGDSK